MKTFLYSPGMRVQVRRARFPMDPALPGRTGRIVHLDDRRAGLYAVVLDGESETRAFTEEELEAADVDAPPSGGSK